MFVLRDPALKYEFGAQETVLTIEFATAIDFGDGDQPYMWRSEAIVCMPGYDTDLGIIQLVLREN